MRLMTNTAADGSEPWLTNAADGLRERLAELEHEQWCAWSRTVAETETLSNDRMESWSRRWVTYGELSDADQDLDRAYADRVIELLRRMAVLPAEGGTDD